MMPSEAFLSHSSANQIVTLKLADELRRHGVPVWYSKENILGAQQWHDEIGQALQRCDWFLIVLSPDAIKAMWVKRELMFALQQERLNGKIVSLIFEPCDIKDLSWVLPTFQVINFHSDFNQGCRELLRVWGIGYKPL